MGTSPPVRTGGQEGFEEGLQRAMAVLGHVIGCGIVIFAVFLIALELVLNPIFLFAQAKAEGGGIGIVSLSWVTIIVVTFTTTGVQYALLQPGANKKGLGFKIGLGMLVMDTAMDGAGFLAWVDSGQLFPPSGDSSKLVWGLFPRAGSDSDVYVGWIVVMAICALHEPFLGRTLGRLTFEPSTHANQATANISLWTERAGKVYNRVKLATIAAAPYIMLGLDVMLFPQATKDKNGVMQFTWVVLTFVVTLTTIIMWEYWNHLQEVGKGKYSFNKVDRVHQGMFLAAIACTLLDSTYDLKGFNQVLFNQDVLWPAGLSPSAYVQYGLTAGLVLLMTTAFEPMNTGLFEPLGNLASKLPGYSDGKKSI